MPTVNTLPPPVAPGPLVQHDGPLLQLSGKGLLAPGSWKRRFCVLDQRRLYFYQLKEDNQGYREQKTSNYVDLEGYDICEEAKGVKTATNVLVISSSEIEKSFFDTGRLYLSSETAAEMNEWISQIRMAMTTLRDGRKPKRSSKSLPADSATNNENKVATTSEKSLEISLVSSSEHLDCITKQRAKGPTGRRLPRHAKSRAVFPLTDATQQQRSESLPRLEQTDPVANIRLSPVKTPTLPFFSHLIDRMKEIDTVQRPAAVVFTEPTEPDHSGFDQSWFLATTTNVTSRVSTPPEVVSSEPERSPPKSTSTRPAIVNRSWSCNFL